MITFPSSLSSTLSGSSSGRVSSVSSSTSFPLKFSMNRFWAIFCMLIVAATIISARPATISNRHKRQSDQRLAELETLLALQKYNGHRVRGWQRHNDLSFGLLDFDKIGRRKKSTSFSPGEHQQQAEEEAGLGRGRGDERNVWNSWVAKSIVADPRNPPNFGDSHVDRK